jgi:hypothetical protein
LCGILIGHREHCHNIVRAEHRELVVHNVSARGIPIKRGPIIEMKRSERTAELRDQVANGSMR